MAEPTPGEVTQLLDQARSGDATALDRLVPVVYQELHAMAQKAMHADRPGSTLQPTALVHEAWMRLVGDTPSSFENRAHFFGAAAEAMRRVLIDGARRRAAQKRGGGRARVTFHDLAVESEDPSLDLLSLDHALAALEKTDRRLSEVVKLRHFVGCSVGQTAEMLGVSPATVKRDWLYARAWLFDAMEAL